MNKKILICDDEEGIRESLKNILGQHYNLIIVETGDQLMHILKNAPEVSVALFDMNMPEINERDFLDQVKNLQPKLKIIMVAGYQSADSKINSTDHDISGYIVKPFKSEEILKTVKKYFK